VPAADYGDRLEVYTGLLTIVIFADDPQRALRAAQALRVGSGEDSTDGELPPPAPGALEGRLLCSGAERMP